MASAGQFLFLVKVGGEFGCFLFFSFWPGLSFLFITAVNNGLVVLLLSSSPSPSLSGRIPDLADFQSVCLVLSLICSRPLRLVIGLGRLTKSRGKARDPLFRFQRCSDAVERGLGTNKRAPMVHGADIICTYKYG